MDHQRHDPENAQSAWIPSFLDSTDADCITYGMPIGLTLIGMLPDELMLEVGGYLEKGSICDLAPVCQRFRSIAESLLYNSIDFKLGSRSVRLGALYRTLRARPELGSLVGSISLRSVGQLCSVDTTVGSVFPSSSTSMDAKAFALLPDHFVVGAILHLLPSLNTLSIYLPDYGPARYHGSFDDDNDSRRLEEYIHPLDKLFGHNFHLNSDLSGKLSDIPAFQNLHTLDCSGSSEFPLSMGDLPNLEHITLSGSLQFKDTEHAEGISKAKSLSIILGTSVLDPEAIEYRSLGALFDHFQNVRKLEVSVHRGSWEPDEEHQALWSTLLERMTAMHPCLEELDIRVRASGPRITTAFLDYTFPSRELRKFSNLRHLKIPFNALIDPEDDRGILDPEPLFNVIPESLEVLELQHPEIRLWEWLQNFVENRTGRCAFLKHIMLHCSSMRGAGYEKLRYTENKYPAPRLLREDRIAISYHCPMEEWNKDWESPDYDPVAEEALDFIASMTKYTQSESVNQGPWKTTLRWMVYDHINATQNILPSRWISSRNAPRLFRFPWIEDKSAY